MKPAILIVDDSPLNIQTLGALLGDGYDLYFATSGAAALGQAQRRPPDLILLDVVMPEMDGYEVCARLKAEPATRSVPVVFVTARDDEADEERGFLLGAADYITKPYRPAVVRARVRNHVELKRQRDLLEQLSLVDPLTGIANRRRFDDHYQQEWQRARRLQHPLTVLVADVDFFKAYNDHYGHPRGDACLRQVAHLLASTASRATDLVARVGGEEFACVLPDTDGAAALPLAEELRARLAAAAIPHVRSTVAAYVTLSVGVATAVPGHNEEPEALLHAADQALYRAKRAGRDRVEEADTDQRKALARE